MSAYYDSMAAFPVGSVPVERIETTEHRQVCSPESPMPKGAPGRWEHTNTKEIYDGGDYARYRCDDCGHEWEEELPQ